MTGTLRRMTAADLPAVLKLEKALFTDEAWSREMFLDELAKMPDSRAYVVWEQDGRLAGYAGLFAAGTECDVQTIAVREELWGRGIGQTLLSELLAEGGRRGCHDIFLEVRADNPRAQRLYEHYGFTVIGRRRGYYQPSGTDAIVMHRKLDTLVPGGAE